MGHHQEHSHLYPLVEEFATTNPITVGQPRFFGKTGARHARDSGEWTTRPEDPIARGMAGYRSRTTTHGRNMAGARALWRANGMSEADFEKTHHRHRQQLHPVRARSCPPARHWPAVKKVIDAVGGWGAEFKHHRPSTTASRWATAGMLYSLPSRDLIADSVEYMVNAHCADAMVCITKLRQNHAGHDDGRRAHQHPDHLRFGGPMEAGIAAGPPDRDGKPTVRKLDLIDSMTAASDEQRSATRNCCGWNARPARLADHARACSPPTAMNCLCEALGLALPGNGTLLATTRDAGIC